MLNRRKIDKEIVDKGWNEMSLLLDAEMPVVWKKRRRLILWFWGVLFLGIIGAFTWYNLAANGETDHEILAPQKLQTENTPIVQSDSETFAPDTKITGNEISDDSGNTHESENLIIESSNENEKLESLVINPLNLKDASRSEVIKDPINAVEDVVESGMDVAKGDNSSTSSEIIVEKSMSNEDKKLIEDRSERIALNINPLPLSIDALTWKRRFQNDLIIEPLNRFSLNPWMIYLNSRLIQYEHFNLELGMGYELKLSSRISIIPQLGFGWDRVDYRQSESQSRAEDFSLANGLDSDRFISDLSKGVKGNYLAFSLDASNRIFGEWYITPGLTYRVPGEKLSIGHEEVALDSNSSNPSAEMSGISSIESNHDLYMRIGISKRIKEYTFGMYFYSQLNDPYDVKVNGVKDSQATSSFFPRRTSLNVFVNYRF